jgi:hypothetical protein
MSYLFLDDLKYMIYRKSFHNGVPFHAFTQHRHNTYTLDVIDIMHEYII